MNKRKSLSKKQKQFLKILELKNTITELKNSREGFIIRPDQVEERISKSEDRAVKSKHSEESQEKRMKKSENI